MKKLKLIKIEASETTSIHSLALAKIQAGEKIFNLSAGEPVIKVAANIKNAIKRSLDDARYPPVAGLPELRILAANWMNKIHGARLDNENTLVVNGGKFGLFLLLQAMLKRGDEVLISAPFWVSYPSIVRLFQAKPKIISTAAESGWKIKSTDIAKNVTARTKILILNNASNPTGALYTKKEIKKILETAGRLGIFVISDEVYSGLVYDGAKYISCASFREHKDQVAIIQSCSKNFAIPGLRVGFVFASKEIVKVLTNLVSQSTTGVSTLSQAAAVVAIKNAKSIMTEVRNTMQARRNLFVREFKREFGVQLAIPQSALYVFVPLTALGSKHKRSVDFCREALKSASVALVPGSAFGQEGFVRFSFGDESKVIKGAIRNLSLWINRK